MTTAETAEFVEGMLRDFSPFSSTLGGLEFYGCSTELRDVLQLCHNVSSSRTGTIENPQKTYLFIEPHHGKTTIAKATDNQAKSNGLTSFYLDGTAGATQKALKDLQSTADAIILVDGMPEAAANRRVVIERFNSLSGNGLLFAPPEYSVDANLDSSVPRLRLGHVDQRLIDKVAWNVGLIRERLRGEAGLISENLSTALAKLPARAFLSLSSVSLGSRIKKLPELANRIAEALQLRIELELDMRMPEEDLAVIFMDFYSSDSRKTGHGFRLWLEGETDCRLLKLVSKLAKAGDGTDLEDGLSILPLGEGREGGTSKAPEVVIKEQTRRNRDVFLFDFDESGKHARDELKILEQDALLLDPKLSCSRSDADVEIEDFINLSCLDRFYNSHVALRPEKEVIRYKSPMARRIVVEGIHKEMLIDWLESNASLADLENVFFVLCEIRARFSLKNPLSTSSMQARRKQLEEEFDQAKQVGNRPRHWSE
jgi:hypothetical protein